MSKFYDVADHAKAMLEGLPAFAGVTVIVDRQKDLDAEVEKAIGKQKGSALVITWEGGDNKAKGAKKVRLGSGYNFTLFCLPVLNRGMTPADDLIQAVCDNIQQWWHEEIPTKREVCFDVVRVIPVRHDKLLVFQVQTQCITQL